MTSGIYLHDWKDSGLEGMKADFGICDAELAGVAILLASYTYESYEGDAFVLFRKDGKLYEVNGSHCSCYGLSESSYSNSTGTQWQPEETTVEALRHRLADGDLGNGRYGGGAFADELRAVLSGLG